MLVRLHASILYGSICALCDLAPWPAQNGNAVFSGHSRYNGTYQGEISMATDTTPTTPDAPPTPVPMNPLEQLADHIATITDVGVKSFHA